MNSESSQRLIQIFNLLPQKIGFEDLLRALPKIYEMNIIDILNLFCPKETARPLIKFYFDIVGYYGDLHELIPKNLRKTQLATLKNVYTNSDGYLQINFEIDELERLHGILQSTPESPDYKLISRFSPIKEIYLSNTTPIKIVTTLFHNPAQFIYILKNDLFKFLTQDLSNPKKNQNLSKPDQERRKLIIEWVMTHNYSQKNPIPFTRREVWDILKQNHKVFQREFNKKVFNNLPEVHFSRSKQKPNVTTD